MHYFTERSAELDCPLRVFEDPAEPIALERTTAKGKSSPFSWCQVRGVTDWALFALLCTLQPRPHTLKRALCNLSLTPCTVQLGINAAIALKRLEERSVGSFVVYYQHGGHRLAYKSSSQVLLQDIAQVKRPSGKTAFQLPGDPDHEFPTLWDLVVFHENNAHSLETKLTVAVASLLARAANKPGLSPALLGPQGWIWCQVGQMAWVSGQPRLTGCLGV